MGQYGSDLAFSHFSFVSSKRFESGNESLVSVESFCRAVAFDFAHDAVEQRWCDDTLYFTTWTGIDVVVISVGFAFDIARDTETKKIHSNRLRCHKSPICCNIP